MSFVRNKILMADIFTTKCKRIIRLRKNAQSLRCCDDAEICEFLFMTVIFIWPLASLMWTFV